MSNKPKGVKRIYPLTENKATSRHRHLVAEAKKQGYKHPGSKSLISLLRIIPMKITTRLSKLFGY